MPFRFIRMTERAENLVSIAPIVIGRSLGSASSRRSIWASLWNGIIIADDRNFQSGFGRSPLTNSSPKFLRRPDVDGRPAMSRISSHVHPSRCGADFFGILVNASITALREIGTNADLYVDGGAWTCWYNVDLVSLARKVAATIGSDSVP